jgi:hypothetical protein
MRLQEIPDRVLDLVYGPAAAAVAKLPAQHIPALWRELQVLLRHIFRIGLFCLQIFFRVRLVLPLHQEILRLIPLGQAAGHDRKACDTRVRPRIPDDSGIEQTRIGKGVGQIGILRAGGYVPYRHALLLACAGSGHCLRDLALAVESVPVEPEVKRLLLRQLRVRDLLPRLAGIDLVYLPRQVQLLGRIHRHIQGGAASDFFQGPRFFSSPSGMEFEALS